MNIPDGYKQVTPYLILKNASDFISYTQKVFGAKEKYKTMRSENVIMHAEVSIGDCVIMFADATEKYQPQPAGFFIYVENADETFKKAVNAGGIVINEIADQSYGRSGGVKDPFGNTWWITSVK
jgi:PhnB protein